MTTAGVWFAIMSREKLRKLPDLERLRQRIRGGRLYYSIEEEARGIAVGEIG